MRSSFGLALLSLEVFFCSQAKANVPNEPKGQFESFMTTVTTEFEGSLMTVTVRPEILSNPVAFSFQLQEIKNDSDESKATAPSQVTGGYATTNSDPQNTPAVSLALPSATPQIPSLSGAISSGSLAISGGSAPSNTPSVPSATSVEPLGSKLSDMTVSTPSASLTLQPSLSPSSLLSTPTDPAEMSASAATEAAAAATAMAGETQESPSHTNSGLSQAAKIGLGVGLGVGVLLLLLAAAGLFFIRRRQRHYHSAPIDENLKGWPGDGPASESATNMEKSTSYPKDVLPPTPPPQPRQRELPATSPQRTLPAIATGAGVGAAAAAGRGALQDNAGPSPPISPVSAISRASSVSSLGRGRSNASRVSR